LHRKRRNKPNSFSHSERRFGVGMIITFPMPLLGEWFFLF
jgi:hypothetical protein